MMRRYGLAALVLAVPAIAGVSEVAAAQRNRARTEPPPAAATSQARRQQMEQQLRRRFWEVTRDRVGLTDAQMARLAETTRRFDAQRRTINQQDRAERVALRQQILAGDRADQNRVAAALDHLLQLQRQRVELQADEQHELAAYMTPIQRARFAALQDEVRRRIEALRRQRPDSAAALGGR